MLKEWYSTQLNSFGSTLTTGIACESLSYRECKNIWDQSMVEMLNCYSKGINPHDDQVVSMVQ